MCDIGDFLVVIEQFGRAIRAEHGVLFGASRADQSVATRAIQKVLTDKKASAAGAFGIHDITSSK